jgi:hypothetical protein
MKDKLLAWWASIKTNISTTVSAVGAYIAKIAAPVLSVALVIGGVVAAIEYKSLMLKLYSWLAKNEMQAADKQDATLKAQEDADKTTSAQAIADATKVEKQGVSDDWYKNEH